MSCGELIKARRDELGWSQRKLAETAGVALMTVSRLERGVHRASPLTQRALAEALGITVAELHPPCIVGQEGASARPPDGGIASDTEEV